jgi:hypothetical protein
MRARWPRTLQVQEETGLDITDVAVAAVENVLFSGGQHYV